MMFGNSINPKTIIDWLKVYYVKLGVVNRPMKAKLNGHWTLDSRLLAVLHIIQFEAKNNSCDCSVSNFLVHC